MLTFDDVTKAAGTAPAVLRDALLGPVRMIGGMPELNEKKRDKLPDKEFAFPKARKEPLNDASHVRNAAARFNQVEGVSEEEKEQAKDRIKRAAKKHGVELSKDPD